MNRFLISAIAAFTSGSALAKVFELTSGEKRTPVIELYTSEGCSSCPPAERWVNTLLNDKGLWKEFIPLVFHVDYWNYLGWTDPLSDEAHAKRQRAYARIWKQSSVYTPGIVRAGSEWKGWRQGEKPQQAEKKATGILKVRESGKHTYDASYTSWSALAETGYTLHAAVLLIGFKSKVTRGENAGASLTHNFSVCSHKSTALTLGKKAFTATIKTDDCSGFSAGRKAVVFWVESDASPEPIQAVGGFL